MDQVKTKKILIALAITTVILVLAAAYVTNRKISNNENKESQSLEAITIEKNDKPAPLTTEDVQKALSEKSSEVAPLTMEDVQAALDKKVAPDQGVKPLTSEEVQAALKE